MWCEKYGIERRQRGTRNKNPFTREELRRLYVEEGVTASAIAKRSGLKVGSILNYCKAFDIKTRQGNPANVPLRDCPVTPQELRELYQCGLSAKLIGRKFGVSHQCVLNWLRHIEVEVKPPGKKAPPCPYTREELADLYDRQGLSSMEIARRTGHWPRNVIEWLRDYQIPIRKGGKQEKFGPKTRAFSPLTNCPFSAECLRAMYEGGRSCPSIAEEAGVCYKTVNRWLRHIGVEIRSRGSYRRQRVSPSSSADGSEGG